MKISFRWLQELLPTQTSVHDAAAVLTATGLEVEGVESVEDLPGGLRGLVVGHITTCSQHPNADRLQVCLVNVGEPEPLQIVCGASNARPDLDVIVALIGAQLYPTHGEPFQIKKGKIRGEVSMGMICGEDEIGVGSSHDGIIELEDSWSPGTPAAEVYRIGKDDVIEVGLTPNRTDGMSHWGVARDLRAGLLHETVEGIAESGIALQVPTGIALPKPSSLSGVTVTIDHPTGCCTYYGLLLEGIHVGPSPDHVQRRLRAIGLNPQNNVVDATNFVLHELGQPLHAFDADTLAGNQVVVRAPLEGEKLTTLDGVERQLDPDDLVISDRDKALCLAGVFGGKDSGIENHTTRVLIESAYFDPVVTRKMARRHGLSTDASFRFERGVDPNNTLLGLQRVAELLTEWAGAKVTGLSEAHVAPLPGPSPVNLEWSFLDRIVGDSINQERVLNILKDLDIQIVKAQAEGLELLVPAYRRDVTRPADVVEEILRLHGFDKVPLPRRISSAINVRKTLNKEGVRQQLAHTLVNRGFQEIMSNSMTRLAYAEALTDDIEDDEIRSSEHIALLNPLSSDLGVMRQSLVFQGLEAISRNRNFQRPDIRLFELGRTYRQIQAAQNSPKPTDRFEESEHISLWLTGASEPENWNTTSKTSGFYDLKREALALLDGLGIRERKEVVENHGVFIEGLAIYVGDQRIGRMGLVNPRVSALCDVQQPVYWADFLVHPLAEISSNHRVVARELPKYPAVRRDLSLILKRGTSFGQVRDAAWQADIKLLKRVGLFDVYEGDKLADDEISYAISLSIQDENKTLTDKRIDQCVERILESIQMQTGARLR
ncbi:MAG: phenylalanine--tRNA ligase subunit beta [Flavobacteriales bacterium]